ncbi:MAG: AAA family ATPase [Actinomycetota bacterium]|nr:AAA family ATPase [Actinomycetota bacterium]
MTFTAEEDAAFLAAADQAIAGQGRNGHVDTSSSIGSWKPLDLAAIIAGIQAGDIVGPVPALMARTDGPSLLYPGEVHSLAGEPESGKGWITLATAVAVITGGADVLYLDFEDAPASIVSRLLALGAVGDAIVDRFVYVRPTDPFTATQFYALLQLRPYAFAVIDGVSEAFALLGLDPYSNPDAATFLTALPRPLADRGSAVLLIDHVVKSKETRGRYALGAQHKLAGIAVAYSTDIIKPPSRADAGLIKIKVEKDRHGHVRGHAQAGLIALAHITPHNDGDHVTVTLEPPEISLTDAGEFRPTVLMERISKFLDDQPGAGLNAIREGVPGKTKYVDDALRLLITENYVRVEPQGQKRCHHNDREYRKDDDHDPATQPRPTTTQVAATMNRDPATPPYKGSRVTGRSQNPEHPTATPNARTAP